MRGNAVASVSSLAQRCKNIMAANCHAYLHTIKADAKGSKDEIHSSKVNYFLRKGKPYLWIPEKDPHNLNTIIDDRGSLSIRSPIPGPLVGLLRSIDKVPSRVAFSGDVIRLADEKVANATKLLKDVISLEDKKIAEASYSVSSIVNSAGQKCRSITESFQQVLDESDNYAVYKFQIRACSFISDNGDIHEVEPDDIDGLRPDVLAPISERLIDGVNQNEARRRALVLLCLVHFNANARDALMLRVDSNGFDILAKVLDGSETNESSHYQWKELRFTFKEEVPDVEKFCSLLVDMEEEALKYVTTISGIC